VCLQLWSFTGCLSYTCKGQTQIPWNSLFHVDRLSNIKQELDGSARSFPHGAGWWGFRRLNESWGHGWVHRQTTREGGRIQLFLWRVSLVSKLPTNVHEIYCDISLSLFLFSEHMHVCKRSDDLCDPVGWHLQTRTFLCAPFYNYFTFSVVDRPTPILFF
jgi:hypothetical protein